MGRNDLEVLSPRHQRPADLASVMGEHGLLLVEGATGLGKTRLLRELASLAEGRGLTVRRLSAPADVLGASGTTLESNELIILDDADLLGGDSTLSLVGDLLRRPPDERPQVAVAMRPPGPRAGVSIVQLRRGLLASGASVLRLTPWSAVESAAFLHGRIGTALSEQFLQAATALSDGVPAALEAICAAIPPESYSPVECEAGSAAELFAFLDRAALRNAVLEFLPAPGTQWFDVAAVCALMGREFEADLIPEFVHVDDPDGFLDWAEDLELLETADGRRYRFTRELVRCVLAWQIPSRRRVQLRRALIAFASNQPMSAAAAESIAEHHREIGEAGQQVDWLERAAGLAESKGDWHRAIGLRTRALAVDDGLPSEGLVQRLRALANCHWHANDQRAAWRLLMRAIDLSAKESDAEGLARAVLDALRIPAPPDRRTDLVNRALTALRAKRSHPDLEARLILQHSLWTPVESRVSPLAEASSDPAKRLLHHTDGIRALEEGRPSEARQVFMDLCQTAFALGRQGWALQLMASANAIPLFEGDLAEGVSGLERTLLAAVEAGNGVHTTGLATWLAGVAFARGDLPGIDRLLAKAMQTNPDHFGLHWLRATIAVQAGDIPAAIANMPREESAGRNPGWLAIVHGSRAMVLEHTGDHERAQLELARWHHQWESLRRHNRDTTLSLVHAATCVDGAIQDAGDLEIVRALFTHLQQWSWVRFAPGNGCVVDRLRGDLARRLGRYREAEVFYVRARDFAWRLDCKVELGKALLGLASIAHDRGERDEGRTLLNRAEGIFVEAGALLLARVVSHALEATSLAADTEDRPSIVPAGLSERELEVLRLLAAGKTNREIADLLVISLNTVARHVTHIFEKTGATNRVEAANFGHEHDIV